MSLNKLPNELILLIGEQLPVSDVCSLVLTSRRFSAILTSQLHALATHPAHSLPALFCAVLHSNSAFAAHILASAPNIEVREPRGASRLPFAIRSPAPSLPAAALDWLMLQQGKLRLSDPDKAGNATAAAARATVTATATDTALSWSITHKHYPLLKRVLDAGAYEYPTSPDDALVQAAFLGDETAVKMLLESGVHPDGDAVRRTRPRQVVVGGIRVKN